MAMNMEQLHPIATETQRVQAWRFSELQRAGYDIRLCALFSLRGDLDLHTLVRAKTNGCSDADAIRIFS